MSRAALLAAALACVAAGQAHGSGAFVDGVRFVQYADESTALEEVRSGKLDVYYYRIPSDRLQGPGARDGLQVHESTGGSYDILLNPAESDRLNPFSSKEVRFALNYLLDRDLMVRVWERDYRSHMHARCSEEGQYRTRVIQYSIPANTRLPHV